MGATSKADPLKISPVAVALDSLHSLLAVSHAETPDQLLHSNVAGFVLVTDIDTTQGTVTYLAPSAGALPGRYLLTGSIKAFLN
jgi:polyribonucleotide 5'-hydroxyl-kinase